MIPIFLYQYNPNFTLHIVKSTIELSPGPSKTVTHNLGSGAKKSRYNHGDLAQGEWETVPHVPSKGRNYCDENDPDCKTLHDTRPNARINADYGTGKRLKQS